jgi:Universal stress protein family
MYEHILVAVGTRPDSITLEAAIRLARETGARLTALHVVDPVPPYAGVDAYDFGVTLDAFEAYGRAVAERSLAAIREAGCEGEARTNDNLRLPTISRSAPIWSLFRENLYKELLRHTATPVLVATDALPAALGRAIALRARYAETVNA